MTANSERHPAFFVMARKERLLTTDVIFSVSCELFQPMGNTEFPSVCAYHHFHPLFHNWENLNRYPRIYDCAECM